MVAARAVTLSPHMLRLVRARVLSVRPNHELLRSSSPRSEHRSRFASPLERFFWERAEGADFRPMRRATASIPALIWTGFTPLFCKDRWTLGRRRREDR